jgi:hypothetical protein
MVALSQAQRADFEGLMQKISLLEACSTRGRKRSSESDARSNNARKEISPLERENRIESRLSGEICRRLTPCRRQASSNKRTNPTSYSQFQARQRSNSDIRIIIAAEIEIGDSID